MQPRGACIASEGEARRGIHPSERQPTVDRLKAVDLLQDCTDAQLEEVARLAERVQVGEGEVLAREGRIGREFFLILSGGWR